MLRKAVNTLLAVFNQKGRPVKKIATPIKYRPWLEALEDRLSPAVVTWDGGGLTNNASDRFNWTGDTAPTINDQAVFDNTSDKNCTMNLVNLQSLHVVGGQNAYDGTITLMGNLTVTQNVIMEGATFAGPGTLSVSNMTWSGGTFTASAKLSVTAPTGTLFITGNVTLSNMAQIQNGGTIRWQDGNITLISTAAIVNMNLIQVECNKEILAPDETGFFNNQSNFNKPNLPGMQGGTTTIHAKFNNQAGGSVSVNIGILLLKGGGSESGFFNVDQNARIDFVTKTFTLQGTSFIGAGTVGLGDNGVFSIQGPVTSWVIFDFGMNQGILNATMTGPGEFTNRGTFNWFSGKLQNLAMFRNVGSMGIFANHNVLIDSSVLLNPGSIVWVGGSIEMTNETNPARVAQILNQRTFDIQTPGTILLLTLPNGLPAVAEFRNENGLVIAHQNLPLDTATIEVKFFQNGTLNVNGYKMDFTNVFEQTAPQALTKIENGVLSFLLNVSIAAGTVDLGLITPLAFGGDLTTGTLTLQQQAKLIGGGTIGGNVINSGTIEPGYRGILAPNTISITGNLTQMTTGRINLGLRQVMNTDYSRIDVTGTVTLAGTLEVYAYINANFAANDVFGLILAGPGLAINGTFNQIMPLPAGHNWNLNQADMFGGRPAVTLTKLP